MTSEIQSRAPEIRDRASKRAPKVFLKPLAVLAYIEEYLSLNGGVSPSQDEIAHAFGQKSRGAATCRALDHLEVNGFIRRSWKRRARDIEVLRPQRDRIPIFRASDNKLMGWLP